MSQIMDQTYGTKAWDETFIGQLDYLPEGPMATFAGMDQVPRGTIPPQLARLWERFQANKIDAQGFASAIKAMKKGQPVYQFLKP